MAMRNCEMCTENSWSHSTDKSPTEIIVTSTCNICGHEVQWSKTRGKQRPHRERQKAKKLRVIKLPPKTEL